MATKVAAGADFIQTQPVFDVDRFNRWMEALRKQGLHEQTHILAGVMPVKSYRALEYMDKKVPGIRIPSELIERMKEAESPKDEGVKICVAMLELERAELAHEQVAHHRDTLDQGLGIAGGLGSLEGAVEIVDHVEKLDEEGTAILLGLLAHLPANPLARIVEIG